MATCPDNNTDPLRLGTTQSIWLCLFLFFSSYVQVWLSQSFTFAPLSWAFWQFWAFHAGCYDMTIPIGCSLMLFGGKSMDFASGQHHLPSSSIPQPRRQADVMLPECVVKAPCPDPESGVPAAYRILASEITWSFSTEKHRKTQLDLPMVVVFRYFQTLGFTWAKCLVCRASHGKNRCATPTVARIISCFSPLLSDSANVYISIY